MKKFIVYFFILIGFSGCFYPFNISEDKNTQIKISDNSPAWLEDPQLSGYLSQVGVSKIRNNDYSFHRQVASINATRKIIKDIYKKSFNVLNEYVKTDSNDSVFEKDIEICSKQIALKSAKKVKVVNSYKNLDEVLFVQVAVDVKEVLKNLQEQSGKLFKVNKKYHDNFLSKKSEKILTRKLEKNVN